MDYNTFEKKNIKNVFLPGFQVSCNPMTKNGILSYTCVCLFHPTVLPFAQQSMQNWFKVHSKACKAALLLIVR